MKLLLTLSLNAAVQYCTRELKKKKHALSLSTEHHPLTNEVSIQLDAFLFLIMPFLPFQCQCTFNFTHNTNLLISNQLYTLSLQSATFRKTARKVHHKMWWKNTKMTLILVGVSLLVLTVIILIILFSTGVLPPKGGGDSSGTTKSPSTTPAITQSGVQTVQCIQQMSSVMVNASLWVFFCCHSKRRPTVPLESVIYEDSTMGHSIFCPYPHYGWCRISSRIFFSFCSMEDAGFL